MLKVDRAQKIGCGAFANVYKISPRRVVKIFWPPTLSVEDRDELIENEVQGCLRSDVYLPVLYVVNVEVKYRRRWAITRGLVKRCLVPFTRLSPKRRRQIARRNGARSRAISWELDHGDKNLGADSRGTIWLLDGQDLQSLSNRFVPMQSRKRR